MKRLSPTILLLLIISGFNYIFSQNLPILRLNAETEHPKNIVTQDFIDGISYTLLETKPECLVDKNPEVIVTRKYILVLTSEKCLLFQRSSGIFLREIGHFGRDPGGYMSTYGFFNESSSTCFFPGWNRNFIKYSLDGVYKGSINIPDMSDNFESPSLADSYSYLEDSLIVCNFMNITGNEKKFIQVFNEKGRVIRTFPNRYIFKNKPFTIATKTVRFHRFNNALYFQEQSTDTVFKLTRDKIDPYFVLDRGKYRPPYESRWWPLTKQKEFKFIYQPIYFENLKFILFTYYFDATPFFGIYNKFDKSLRVTQNKSGIKNNSDNFIDLTFTSINSAGELSCIVQPHVILEWIRNHPESFKTLKPDLQKLQYLNLEDNPVVVVAKVKN
jgi:hypothetical protein